MDIDVTIRIAIRQSLAMIGYILIEILVFIETNDRFFLIIRDTRYPKYFPFPLQNAGFYFEGRHIHFRWGCGGIDAAHFHHFTHSLDEGLKNALVGLFTLISPN